MILLFSSRRAAANPRHASDAVGNGHAVFAVGGSFAPPGGGARWDSMSGRPSSCASEKPEAPRLLTARLVTTRLVTRAPLPRPLAISWAPPTPGATKIQSALKGPAAETESPARGPRGRGARPLGHGAPPRHTRGQKFNPLSRALLRGCHTRGQKNSIPLSRALLRGLRARQGVASPA